MTPTSLRQIVSATYPPPFGKVWLSSDCYLRLRSLAMKWNAEFTEGGWKPTSNLKPFVDKVHVVLRRRRRLLVVCNAFAAYVYHVSFLRYRPLKLRTPQKRWVLGARFVGGGDTPDFGHAFSNYTYFRSCGRTWLSSVQRGRRLEGKLEMWQL